MEERKVNIIIPTYRPGISFRKLLECLLSQSLRPEKIIIINTDKHEWDALGGDFMVQASGAEGTTQIVHIDRNDFRHGYARNLGASLVTGDCFICMTQDAMPADDKLISNMISSLDGNIAMSYARQIAYDDADEIEKITRTFNYPEESVIKSSKDKEKLGIKTYFASNVCAAYDKAVFDKLGGFADLAQFNEDMIYASKLINAGYRIKYQADATVYHSHNYTLREQYERNKENARSQKAYSDSFIGVKSESEGIRLVRYTAKELVKSGKAYLIPKLIASSGAKYLGFRSGMKE